MERSGIERRLATIMAADVVGYSRLMAAAEEATIHRLEALRSIVEHRVTSAGGRTFSLAGDGFLVEFSSPVAAVRTAYDIQRDLAQSNREMPDPENSESLQLRVGVHVADVVVQGDDLLGDGVNVASRIETAAAPGSVTVSQTVFDHVKRSAALLFEDLGEHELKNIPEPVRLLRVVGEQPVHSMESLPRRIANLEKEQLPPVDKPSIAVLPFINMSGDPGQDYLADGFTEDIITELARFKALFVVSRNASFAYRGHDVDLRQVGRELGVATCLEGSVRKLRDRVRITAQLIDTASGEHLWADRTDCNLEDLFDTQDEIVSQIVATVAHRVEDTATTAARGKRPKDQVAYDCLLRGLEYHRLGSITRDHALKAVEWFERSIEKDPGYGRAHAWHACAIAKLGDWSDNMNWLDECIDCAERALELDSNDGEIHRIMGSICLEIRNFEKAEYHFLRGIELNPNHAYIMAKTAELYNYLGDGDRALEMLAGAQRLDPFLPDYCREAAVIAYYILERYDDAVTAKARLSRLTRRAAVYGAASASHCIETEDEAAARDLLRIDPDFQIRQFVSTEPFRDREHRQRLKNDLKALGLPL